MTWVAFSFVAFGRLLELLDVCTPIPQGLFPNFLFQPKNKFFKLIFEWLKTKRINDVHSTDPCISYLVLSPWKLGKNVQWKLFLAKYNEK